MDLRVKVWKKIATDWKIGWLDRITRQTDLEALNACVDRMLRHQSRGRTVVRLFE